MSHDSLSLSPELEVALFAEARDRTYLGNLNTYLGNLNPAGPCGQC
jgi:hypothetical protein